MDGTALRVLLVEDDEDDYILTRDLLAEVEGQPFDLDWVAGYDAALAAIGQGRHEVYLLDYRLGARTGLDLLREALHRGCHGPLILLTGQGDRAVDIEAMRCGAADYLPKDRMNASQLERSIRYAVERKRAEDQLRRMRDELEQRVDARTAELARANDALRRAKEAAEAASQAKDQFLAVLSHELRTPLNPVLMGVSALLEDPQVPPALRPILEVARRNVELEARLIDDLLDITRIAQGKLRLGREVVDVHGLVLRAAEICREEIAEAGLTLEVVFEATAHHADGDPARLQQIAWNLIKNAVKFTPRGGRITIRSRSEGSGNGAAPRLIVEVSDTGIGIAPAALPRIFNTFDQGHATVTQQFGGLGLGLAICRSLAEAHGGRLSVRSDGEGRGATFTLELPAVPTPPPAMPLPDSLRRAEPLSTTLSILLVEDNQDTLWVMSRLLDRRGYRTVTASTMAEALQTFESAGPFDVVISDLGLPDGSGLDLLRTLHQRGPVPGIALSGYGMDADLRRSAEAGFLAHLVKPVDFQRLEDAIRQVTR